MKLNPITTLAALALSGLGLLLGFSNCGVGQSGLTATTNSVISVSSTLFLKGVDQSIPTGSTVQLTAGGGAPPYAYSTSKGCGTIDGNGNYTAPSTAGTCVVQVTDSVKNTAITSVVITAPAGQATGACNDSEQVVSFQADYQFAGITETDPNYAYYTYNYQYTGSHGDIVSSFTVVVGCLYQSGSSYYSVCTANCKVKLTADCRGRLKQAVQANDGVQCASSSVSGLVSGTPTKVCHAVYKDYVGFQCE